MRKISKNLIHRIASILARNLNNSELMNNVLFLFFWNKIGTENLGLGSSCNDYVHMNKSFSLLLNIIS